MFLLLDWTVRDKLPLSPAHVFVQEILSERKATIFFIDKVICESCDPSRTCFDLRNDDVWVRFNQEVVKFLWLDW